MLLYAYAHGIFSSRRIEAATYTHLSLRFLAGNTHPDHNTIAAFRRFRCFHLRGLAGVNLEWQLVGAALNCRRLAARRGRQR